MVANTYTSNSGAHKYIKQILKELKVERNSSSFTVGGLSTSLSIRARSLRQRISKEIARLIYFVSKSICMFTQNFISKFCL